MCDSTKLEVSNPHILLSLNLLKSIILHKILVGYNYGISNCSQYIGSGRIYCLMSLTAPSRQSLVFLVSKINLSKSTGRLPQKLP